MKKIFIITSVLLVVILIFLGIYNFAFRTKQNDSIIKNDTVKQNSVEDIDENRNSNSNDIIKNSKERIIPVTKSKVIAPFINKDANVILFYDKESGMVKEISINGGSEKIISDVQLNNFSYAIWAMDANRVLTKFVDARNQVSMYFFDHSTKSGIELKEGINRIDWTQKGDQIVYTFFDRTSQRASLNIAHPDGASWRILSDNIPKDTRFIHIPESSKVAFWNAPNKYEKTTLKIVSIIDKSSRSKTIFSGHYNSDYLFSPNGERILVSSTQERGSNSSMLGITNGNGGEYQNLRIPTSIDKCVWAMNNRIIYCAFPTGDRDTFWKIDVMTNKKERILDLDSVLSSSVTYQAFDLFLSPDGESLFFINSKDSRLYRILL